MINVLIKYMVGMIFVLIWMNSYGKTDEPVLIIETKSNDYSFSRSTLLLKKLAHITMKNNRAYPNREMTYTAVKLCELFKPFSITSRDTLEFIATDGFSVFIPAKYVMHCDNRSSVGYLAIEPDEKWPLLQQYNAGTTAGPFDVIWVDPEKSSISDEYWAWSVVKIIIHEKLDASLVSEVPKIRDRRLQKRIANGYHQYISHCAACHAMNHIGKGVIGPDLNIPKNPVEYYPNDDLLKKFIRDPQSVRTIKYDRMSGSSEKFLSATDLDDLILYFHYMAKHKKTSTNSLKR